MTKKPRKRKRKTRKWIKWKNLSQKVRDSIDLRHYLRSIGNDNCSIIRKDKRGKIREYNDFFAKSKSSDDEVY